ncbi:MAG: Gfo/Idh/MocA family oxidoreductase [Clostridia bacterium]
MKQITAVLAGAGQRGADTYAAYALTHPEEMKVVAVAEPIAERREAVAKAHHIAAENVYESWEQLFQRPKMADFAMICTQDRMHAEPVEQAMRSGYPVLCEKPMSPDPRECMRMGRLSREYHKSLTICHVLRYSPFYGKLKELLDSGIIGDLIHIVQIENVAYWHQAHSFVRGNWRNSHETSPMILQKSCHDMDILLWLMGKPCEKVSSFGALTHFKAENAPLGSAERCLHCDVATECPYNAYHIYMGEDTWYTPVIRSVVSQAPSREALKQALDTGAYGRCVYHCDNDVVDHQTVNLAFEGGATASFTMCAFTQGGGRSVNLMGTRGQIIGDMEENTLTVMNFLTGKREVITIDAPPEGHSGSDSAFMRDVLATIADEGRDARSSAEKSVMSHMMALAAEESRVTGRTIELKEYMATIGE